MDALDTIWRLPPYEIKEVVTALSETIPWSLTSYGIPEAWKQTRGKGVVVGVADTGIDDSHPDLRDAIKDARDFTGSPVGPLDRQGHGSHVAGTIAATQGNDVGVAGIAPEAKLLIAKVLGDDGSGSDASVANGIRWLVDGGAHIISMSLGSPYPSGAIRSAIVYAIGKGRFVICAAGNDGKPNSVNYPAKWPEVCSVAAVDANGQAAQFSSQGPENWIAAPGQDVLSTFKDGRYAKLSGTSMATPFVSGVVALLLARNAGSPNSPVKDMATLKEHLRRTARDAGPMGRDPHYGWGLIDPATMLRRDEPAPTDPVNPQWKVTCLTPGGPVLEYTFRGLLKVEKDGKSLLDMK